MVIFNSYVKLPEGTVMESTWGFHVSPGFACDDPARLSNLKTSEPKKSNFAGPMLEIA